MRPMATKDFIGYPQLMDKALRGVIRQALTHASKGGIMGSHHFMISFDTNAPGVRLSDTQRAKFPVEMTIVLQNQYWDLKVHDDEFEVGLSFQKMPETLVIPFAAITQFVDPSQNFGFKLLDTIATIPFSNTEKSTYSIKATEMMEFIGFFHTSKVTVDFFGCV